MNQIHIIKGTRPLKYRLIPLLRMRITASRTLSESNQSQINERSEKIQAPDTRNAGMVTFVQSTYVRRRRLFQWRLLNFWIE